MSITQPEYLIADLAVNGRFPPNSSVRFPQSLVIRSIKGVAAPDAEHLLRFPRTASDSSPPWGFVTAKVA